MQQRTLEGVRRVISGVKPKMQLPAATPRNVRLEDGASHSPGRKSSPSGSRAP